MDALVDSKLKIPGWSPAVEEAGPSGSGLTADMSDAASAPHSPRHLHKRRRLSRLLVKLAEHFRIHSECQSKWINFNAPNPPEEMPLDLSVKPNPPPEPPVEPEPASEVPQPSTSNEVLSYSCGVCGQSFSVHDRLAKHVASRHKAKTPESSRAYECKICGRRFARSDMLTRHARLHSGVKPYCCSICCQVFSRSDHLSTHYRTHTGEKPYNCPCCSYAACRRDMITRHMKTHTRYMQPASF